MAIPTGHRLHQSRLKPTLIVGEATQALLVEHFDETFQQQGLGGHAVGARWSQRAAGHEPIVQRILFVSTGPLERLPRSVELLGRRLIDRKTIEDGRKIIGGIHHAQSLDNAAKRRNNLALVVEPTLTQIG